MLKKLFAVVTFLTILVMLVACNKDIKVTFETNGGSEVKQVVLPKAQAIAEFDDPVKANWNFLGWYTDKELTNQFDFATVIDKSMTLYAGWTQEVAVRFNTKTTASVKSVKLGTGGEVAKPADPKREGYRFGGWFYGKPGLTTYEPQAVEFPLNVTKGTTLYAYWEPLDSKNVTYSKDETYTQALQSSTALILNPLVYKWSHEDDYIDMLVTPMYSTEVDWDLAISQGVADYYGDFSKVEKNEYSIEAFDYKYILVGAVKYPMDSKGDQHLTKDGQYDRAGATKFKDKEWTFEIREDLKFEDGTPIDAYTFEYTLKQFLDPAQANYRATIFYKDEENKNGYPILNSGNYLKGVEGIKWEDVGFKVLSKYSFKVIFSEEQTQSAAVGFANALRLLHPAKYAASLNAEGINSTYGTAANPFVSYGPYIIKSWDENQKIVFNKNYDYVAKQTINYKSQVIEIVSDLAKAYQLFKDGTTNVLGLTNDYYAEFSEDPNLYKSWNGYPQYIILNTAKSKATTNPVVHPTIMYNVKFRQALFYGFNRNYYADSVYAPNTATTLTIPLDTKAYIQDPLFYSQSGTHKEVLAKHGIDEATNGYIPERAKALFNEAYAEWIAEGNSGPVRLKYVADNGTTLSESLANYIKQSLEQMFGTDKLIIDIAWGDTTMVSAAQANWDFDMCLSSIGFGASYGIQWQYPAITFMGALAGAGALGLSQPYQYDPETDADVYAPYYDAELEVDLKETYDYLVDLKANTDEEDWLEDYQTFLDALEATEDKEAGIYKGPASFLGDIMMNLANPYDGTAAAPFPGATQEVWKIAAAFEDLFYQYCPLIPTVTRSSATVYKNNVKILWPRYSSAFAWGSQRYRYLTTDPDFSLGLYNSFAK